MGFAKVIFCFTGLLLHLFVQLQIHQNCNTFLRTLNHFYHLSSS